MCFRGRLKAILVVISVLFSVCGRKAAAQDAAAAGTIHGQVLDLQTGEPLAKARVSIAGQARSVTTDATGNFVLTAVPAGTVELRVFTVGYGLLKRSVQVAANGDLQLEIRLGQEALRDSLQVKQQVNVVAGPFDPVVPDGVSEYSLNSTERQDLSTVLANDPFRALTYLPSVTANQDFYAEFAIRGAGLAHIGVFLDGALVDRPTYGLEDSADIGSLSVVNGDVVGSLTVLSGGFPVEYGDRTGAVLDVVTRDGDRDRIDTRLTADVLGAVATSEGPLGRSHKGSWLISGRQSYVAFLLSRLGLAGGLTLNYDDAFGKLTFDPNPRNRLNFETTFGGTTAERSPIYTAGQEASFFTAGAAQHGMSAAHWGWTPAAKTVVASQAYWTYDHEHDTNLNSAVDLDTTSNVDGSRVDVTQQMGASNHAAAGAEWRGTDQQRDSFTQWNFVTDTVSSALLPFDHYARWEQMAGGYLEDTATLLDGRLTLNLGGRWEYFRPAAQNTFLPYAGAMVKASASTTVSAAYGQYAQMPTPRQLYGAFGTPGLRAERATHEDVAVDQLLSERARLHVEVYNREEHEDVYSPETEFRLLPNGQVGFPVLGPVLGNFLDAYARGFEIELQRRSANRLSGWVSYARSYSTYWQPKTSLRFPGDYDQRDSVSAYAAFRLTQSMNVSADSRYGSGYPIPGFLTASPYPIGNASNTPVYFDLSPDRNTLRLDHYLRNDARVNKIFARKRFNLTVHGEIENFTGHRNFTYFDFVYPGGIGSTHLVYAMRQSTLPLLPAAGLTLEF